MKITAMSNYIKTYEQLNKEEDLTLRDIDSNLEELKEQVVMINDLIEIMKGIKFKYENSEVDPFIKRQLQNAVEKVKDAKSNIRTSYLRLMDKGRHK